MTRARVLEGTWDELKRQAEELARSAPGHRLKLIVLTEEAEPAERTSFRDSGRQFFETASHEDLARALDRIAESSRPRPVLPDGAFLRESLYEDRW